MTRRLGVAAGLLAAILAVSGCGDGGPDSQTEDQTQFSSNPTGELKAWGFDNADDVGKARLDHAKSKSSALLDQKTPEQALADAQAAAMRAYDKVAG